MFANLDPGVSRREFLGMTAASLLIAGSLNGAAKPDTKNGIPYRTLGRTGEKVSVVGLGGYHLARQSDPEESVRIIRTGIDEGINFLDNCWSRRPSMTNRASLGHDPAKSVEIAWVSTGLCTWNRYFQA
jgi:hypothetical protein